MKEVNEAGKEMSRVSAIVEQTKVRISAIDQEAQSQSTSISGVDSDLAALSALMTKSSDVLSQMSHENELLAESARYTAEIANSFVLPPAQVDPTDMKLSG